LMPPKPTRRMRRYTANPSSSAVASAIKNSRKSSPRSLPDAPSHTAAMASAPTGATIKSPSPRISSRRISGISFKLVADTPDRCQVARVRRVRLDLFPQAANMHRDRARIAVKLVPPDMVEQLAALEHLPGMRSEEPQQVEFLARQLDRSVVNRHRPRARVNPQRAAHDHALAGIQHRACGHPPEHRFDA